MIAVIIFIRFPLLIAIDKKHGENFRHARFLFLKVERLSDGKYCRLVNFTDEIVVGENKT